MIIRRVAYEASFAVLVFLVVHHDSRRFENQRILRDRFHWLPRFVFLSYVSASLEVFWSGKGLDCSGAPCERLGSFRNSLECLSSVLQRLGSVWEAFWESLGSCGGFGARSEFLGSV